MIRSYILELENEERSVEHEISNLVNDMIGDKVFKILFLDTGYYAFSIWIIKRGEVDRINL